MSLRRLLLMLPILLLLLAAGAWFWLLHTQSGARWIWSRVESAADGALTAGNISGDLSSGITAIGISFNGDGIEVSVSEVSLAIDVNVLPMRVFVLPARVANLLVELGEQGKTEDGANLHQTLSRLRSPVELVFTRIDLDGAAIDSGSDDSSFVIDSASLAARWHDEIVVERIDLESAPIGASGSGQVLLYGQNDVSLNVDLDARTELTGLDEAVAIRASVRGPLDALELEARADDPRATLRGTISGLADDARWDLQLDLPAIDIGPRADLPTIPTIAVTARGHGGLHRFTAQAQIGFAGTDMEVTLAAGVDIEAATVSGDLDWQNAHWPVGAADTQIRSRTGKVRLSGSLDDWTIEGDVDLEVPNLPPGRFTIEGRGNRDGASAEILDGNVFGGRVAGRAEYRWREPQTYGASLELENIQTATVLPDWPAMLSGKLDVSGQQQPLRVSATLTDVSGEFRGRPLKADGRIIFDREEASVDDLWLRHGATSVRVSGQPYARQGLQFDVVIDDLGQYIGEAFGSLSASGAASLDPGAQFLRVDASGENLGYRGLRIASLALTDRNPGGSVFDADVAIDGLSLRDIHIDQLRLRPRIGRQLQALDLDIVDNGLRSGLGVSGELDSWERPHSWTGQLTRLEIERDEFSAAVDEPADISISQHSAQIEGLCLSGGRGANLCGGGSWRSDAGFDVMANLSSVPVDLLNAFIETDFGFDQVLSGQFTWRMDGDGVSSGRADIDMTAGTMVSTEDPDLRIETGQAKLSFDIVDDSLRGGIVDVPLPGLGHVAAGFEMLDIADQGAAAIGGSVDIDLDDLGLLVVLFPAIDDAGGALLADVDIAGTINAPRLTGDIALRNGTLSYLPVGLRLDEIELETDLQESGEIELTGSLRAGEGRAQIRTRADHIRTAATGLELTLRGENLTIIDVPDITAVANPDVRIDFDGKSLRLNGSISIPRARVRPANIGLNRVYESNDVVIVAGELPDEAGTPKAGIDLEVLGSLEVSLGNDVAVNLEVAQTDVTGRALLTWSGDPMPTAVGSYDVDGRVVAFGQRLEITEGSVRFPEVPVNDPYLRIRAEREIFGNTQVRRAGVLVAGTASRPTVEAYTIPMTTEERALTLLVTGSDFDLERGVGAVDFGTYIAPRVFVSYGIGLFDEERVIRVRYDLKRGFGVTGTSGLRESGVDLSYNFEN